MIINYDSALLEFELRIQSYTGHLRASAEVYTLLSAILVFAMILALPASLSLVYLQHVRLEKHFLLNSKGSFGDDGGAGGR